MAGTEVGAAVGKAGVAGQGPYMLLFLFVRGGEIVEAHFQSHGCPSARACGEWVCERIRGLDVEQAGLLEACAIAKGVGGLPLGKEFCAGLAITALRDGLAVATGCEQQRERAAG